MKRILLILPVALLLCVLPPNVHRAESPSPCNCGGADTTAPADSVRDAIQANQQKVDSFVTSKKATLDTLEYKIDSVSAEIKRLKIVAARRRLVMRDTWLSVDTAEQGYKWYRNVWHWYYYRYPDGNLVYDTVIKRQYPVLKHRTHATY